MSVVKGGVGERGGTEGKEALVDVDALLQTRPLGLISEFRLGSRV